MEISFLNGIWTAVKDCGNQLLLQQSTVQQLFMCSTNEVVFNIIGMLDQIIFKTVKEEI